MRLTRYDRIPTKVDSNTPAIPKRFLEKARWYIDNQATHVYAIRHEGKPAFFVLSKSAANGATKITPRLQEMFNAAMCGEKDARIRDLDTLIGTCQSLHVVCEPADGYEDQVGFAKKYSDQVTFHKVRSDKVCFQKSVQISLKLPT